MLYGHGFVCFVVLLYCCIGVLVWGGGSLLEFGWIGFDLYLLATLSCIGALVWGGLPSPCLGFSGLGLTVLYVV